MTAPRESRVTIRADRWLDGDRFLGFRLTVRYAGAVLEVVEVPTSPSGGIETMAEVRRKRVELEERWLPRGGTPR